MLIWTSNEAKSHSACQEYRIRVPLNTLYDLHGVQSYEDRGENQREAIKFMFNADVIQLYSLSGESILHKIQTIHDIKPQERDGEMRVPPAFIYDADDNADFVHPFNNTFGHMGVRAYPDARLLKPGDCLEWKDEKGVARGCWIDQETESGPVLFDIARNLHNMKVRHEIIRTCDGATASSAPLASYFRDVCGQKHVHVYPNTVVPEDYPKFRAVRENTDEVRILWQGSASHIVDWYPLRSALKTIAAKYPNVKFVIFGEWFDFIHDVIPDHMVEHHGWVEYAAYKLYRGLLNCDINLCPLADNPFNRCKSAIKWYEASVWKDRPEATLAQATAPYQEIVDGETGLLYKTPAEFVEKLSLLIEDAQLRARLGANAHEWVFNNRLPQHTTRGLYEFYSEVRARQVRERTGRSLVTSATQKDIALAVQTQEALLKMR